MLASFVIIVSSVRMLSIHTVIIGLFVPYKANKICSLLKKNKNIIEMKKSEIH